MSSGSYRQVYVQCPFYKFDDGKHGTGGLRMATEKRLIDTELLIRDINADPYRTEIEKSYDRCLMCRQPTVDAVEVVRCKDCRWAREKDHREPTDIPRELICQCFQHHYIPAPWGARMAVSMDDFCSYGERKD